MFVVLSNKSIPSFSVDLRAHLESLHILWHDHTKPDALTYLGFPLFFGKAQETAFWDKMSKKIQAAIHIHSLRSLSVFGRAIVVNALILSRLWDLAWVINLPPSFLRRVRLAVTNFVNPFHPKASWNTITTPRSKGGLGVIDPTIQCQG